MICRSRLRFGVHLFDRVDQIGQPFEREVLALHGAGDHAVRRASRSTVSMLRDGGQSIRVIVVAATSVAPP